MDLYCEIDYQSPNELDYLVAEEHSDKGNADGSAHHNYTKLYYALFEPVREQPLSIFEMGIGTTNLRIPSSMGPNGVPGASLHAWKRFFPNATIVGGDIDGDILFQEDRIETYQVDQTSALSLHNLWNGLGKEFDILIDDGLHTFEANVSMFENSIHLLGVGGVYIIEDITTECLAHLERLVENVWKRKYKNFVFEIVILPHTWNHYDNTMLLAQRLE